VTLASDVLANPVLPANQDTRSFLVALGRLLVSFWAPRMRVLIAVVRSQLLGSPVLSMRRHSRYLGRFDGVDRCGVRNEQECLHGYWKVVRRTERGELLRIGRGGIALLMTSKRRGVSTGLLIGSLVLVLCACSTSPAVGSKTVKFPVTACPAQSRVSGPTNEKGAAQKLVPFAPANVTLCQYKRRFKPVGTYLVAAAVQLGPDVGANLASELDHDVSAYPSGPVNCPNDTGSRDDAYFWGAAHHVEVEITTDGCEVANNGNQTNAFVGNSNVTGQLSAVVRSAQRTPNS
jgi:hypothetical protein